MILFQIVKKKPRKYLGFFNYANAAASNNTEPIKTVAIGVETISKLDNVGGVILSLIHI